MLRIIARQPTLRRAVFRYRAHDLTDRDVYVASYRRSGNTWARFLIAELCTGKPTDFVEVERLIPVIGKHVEAPQLLPNGGRIIKSHEGFRPGKGKALYLLRDGRDVAVSEFYFSQRRGLFEGSFTEFLALFVRGEASASGSWQENVLYWLNAPDALVIRYEEMLSDTAREVRRMVDFLGLEISSERIAEVVSHNTAREMRATEQVSHPGTLAGASTSFVRSATKGEWRAHFDDALLDTFMAYCGEAMAKAGYHRDSPRSDL